MQVANTPLADHRCQAEERCMDSIVWKVKQMFRNLVPLAIVIGILYGGYHFYRRGAFRHGLVPGITSMLRSIPVLGSRFGRHHSSWSLTRSEYHGRHHRGHRGHRRHHRR